MSLLQGGGLKVGGRKIPLSVLAVVAAVGVALLIVRRLQASQSAVVVGAPPDLTGSGFQASLDQLTASTESLQTAVGQLTGAAQGQGQGTVQPIPSLHTIAVWDNPAGFPGGFPAGEVPVFSMDPHHQGIIGYVRAGSPLQGAAAATGFAGDSGFDIQFQGQTGFLPGRYTELS